MSLLSLGLDGAGSGLPHRCDCLVGQNASPLLCRSDHPGVAAMVEKYIDVIEHAVGQIILAHELPDVLCGFSSGHFGGKGTMVMLSGTEGLPERCQPA